jgi:hypothetical protein
MEASKNVFDILNKRDTTKFRNLNAHIVSTFYLPSKKIFDSLPTPFEQPTDDTNSIFFTVKKSTKTAVDDIYCRVSDRQCQSYNIPGFNP